MINRVTLVGRMTKRAEIRFTENDTPVATFTIAVSRIKPKEADFINCVAWTRLAEIIEKYTDKGKQVAIDGRIQTRNYEDEAGNKHYVTEVVVEHLELLGNKVEENNLEEAETIEEMTSDDLPF